MFTGFELVLAPESPSERSLTLGSHPVYVGRSPQSDLVVSDNRVSWQHVRVWVQEGVVRVADLGSRNGTWVNDRRVLGTTTALPGDTIRVGERVQLVVRGGVTVASDQQLVIEEVDTGLRYPFRGDRFQVGPDPSADLRVAGTQPIEVLRGGGGFVVRQAEDQRLVATGVTFQVGPLVLRVRSVSVVPRSTVGDGSGSLLPYDVVCWLSRAVVEVRGPGGQELARLAGEAQATLMWVLAEALVADAALPEVERGWRDEHHVMVRVWGRGGLEAAPNRLKVLLHRVRKVLREACVDPELVERADGRLRLRAARASHLA